MAQLNPQHLREFKRSIDEIREILARPDVRKDNADLEGIAAEVVGLTPELIMAKQNELADRKDIERYQTVGKHRRLKALIHEARQSKTPDGGKKCPVKFFIFGDDQSDLLPKDRTLDIYHYPHSHAGMVVVACRRLGDGKKEHLHFGLSFCSPLDRFDKHEGWRLALDRLEEKATKTEYAASLHYAKRVPDKDSRFVIDVDADMTTERMIVMFLYTLNGIDTDTEKDVDGPQSIHKWYNDHLVPWFRPVGFMRPYVRILNRLDRHIPSRVMVNIEEPKAVSE